MVEAKQIGRRRLFHKLKESWKRTGEGADHPYESQGKPVRLFYRRDGEVVDYDKKRISRDGGYLIDTKLTRRQMSGSIGAALGYFLGGYVGKNLHVGTHKRRRGFGIDFWWGNPQGKGSENQDVPVAESPEKEKSAADSDLETRIGNFVSSKKSSGYLNSTDNVRVTIYDIERSKKIVSIDEDKTTMAASTVKDYVMLAVFHEVKEGKLDYNGSSGKRIKGLLEKMIRKSDNNATNQLIDLVGGPQEVDKILRENYRSFNETKIVEKIPAGGRTYRNTTSTHDLNIFYNQMWKGNLPFSDEMKRYLKLQKRDRLFDGTCIPDGTTVFNKTGTVYGVTADSGILIMKDSRGKEHPYIISVLIEDKTKPQSEDRSDFKPWVRKRAGIIRSISEEAYSHLFKSHTGKDYMCTQHNGKHLR